jgi:hypothetical protein
MFTSVRDRNNARLLYKSLRTYISRAIQGNIIRKIYETTMFTTETWVLNREPYIDSCIEVQHHGTITDF